MYRITQEIQAALRRRELNSREGGQRQNSNASPPKLQPSHPAESPVQSARIQLPSIPMRTSQPVAIMSAPSTSTGSHNLEKMLAEIPPSPRARYRGRYFSTVSHPRRLQPLDSAQSETPFSKPRAVQFKPYSLDDYRCIQDKISHMSGKLGPNLETDEYKEKV